MNRSFHEGSLKAQINLIVIYSSKKVSRNGDFIGDDLDYKRDYFEDT